MSDKRLLLWGVGGHGKVVAEVAASSGWELVGFIDLNESVLTAPPKFCGGAPGISQDSILAMLAANEALPGGATAIALGIGDNDARLRCAAAIDDRLLPALVHPRAVVSPSARLAPGTVVMAGAVVNADAAIGRASVVNSAAIVEHDCTLGEGSHVSPGAVLTGGVAIGASSWIGAGATILPGRNVGERATVGAGAVVVHDVAASTTVIGNPAREYLPAR